MDAEFKIFSLADVPETLMSEGRGIQKHMVNSSCGTENIDVHLNVLKVGEPGGRYHLHTNSDNVYIVKCGVGSLVYEGVTHKIKEDDVIYIPAGHKHSLTNSGLVPLELFEIYTPAGKNFDFVIVEGSENEP